MRRHSVARYLLAASTVKAAASGFHPLKQARVDRPRPQVLSYQSLNVRHRDRIVQAWANDDDAALDDAWVSDAAVDLGSECGQYEYATSIGFRCLRSALSVLGAEAV